MNKSFQKGINITRAIKCPQNWRRENNHKRMESEQDVLLSFILLHLRNEINGKSQIKEMLETKLKLELRFYFF